VAASVLRSLLFLPANRADRFAKALGSGADAVCLDLEDALPPAEKEAGLATVLELLAQPRAGVLVAVRVNDVNSERGHAELRALALAETPPDALLIPKASGVEDIVTTADAVAVGARWGVPPLPLVPIIETALGLSCVEQIAKRSPDRTLALMLGGVDLTAEMGAALEWDSLLYARSRVVHAAALAGGLATLDTPSLEVGDLDGLLREARAACRLGFTGKAAIHPAQLPAIHEAFQPSDAEVERARRVVQAFEDSRGGVVLVDGRMVDPPVVRAAQRTLALADRAR
jgi:citrate lyase beta subunit